MLLHCQGESGSRVPEWLLRWLWLNDAKRGKRNVRFVLLLFLVSPILFQASNTGGRAASKDALTLDAPSNELVFTVNQYQIAY